jgi:rRNA processing protein Gar1
LPSVPSPFKVIRGSTNSESGYLGLVVHPSYGEEKELTKKKKKKRKEKEKRSLHDKCPRACEKQL